MALTDQLTTVTQYFLELFEERKETLHIKQVYDGDMALIPETPTLAIIAGRKLREYAAAPMVTRVDLQVAFMLYHNRIQEVQKQQREVLELSEAVEAVLHEHEHQTLGGLVIVGIVTAVEPGYADRQGSVLRTTRLTWEAQSRVGLPTS